jgi:release factor glutamine methyltransferase
MELPEDYKRGFKEFLGVKVDLSFRPLIPREETEYWVKKAIKEMKEGSQCLDLFAGSGCVGLAVLRNISNSFCDFGDIEERFLKGIEKSAKENKIDERRFDLIKTDVFSNINKKYDYILSNPPYVAEKRIDEVGEDVKAFEPSVALYGGGDGMEYVEKFLTEAAEYLREKGVVYMEFDPEQKDVIEKIVTNRYSKSEFFKDEFDKYRFLRLEK